MKLYFYYGVMDSSKTANALMKKWSFEEHGRRVALLKPAVDSRHTKTTISSRCGLSSEAIVIYPTDNVLIQLQKEFDGKYEKWDIVIVDEVQFFTTNQIDELRVLANAGIMVMCYGLKTDYTGHLFEGSKRLLEICDSEREIPAMCSQCSGKAIMNAKHYNNNIIYGGEDVIDIGGNEKYTCMCHKCWIKGKVQTRNKSVL